MEYAQDGDLGRYDPADIADAAGWEGDSEAFVDALLECGPGATAGFLEHRDGRLHVHDWEDYAGPLMTSREEGRRGNHERWHVRRGMHDPNCPYCIGGDSGANLSGAIRGANPKRIAPDSTVPNRTVPNLTKPNTGVKPPARAREDRPAATADPIAGALKRAGMIPSPTIIEHLDAFIEDGAEVALVVYAIEMAALRGILRADYILGILRPWVAAGITTRTQAEAVEVSRQKSAGARASPGQTAEQYPDLSAKNAELIRRKEVSAVGGQGSAP